MTFNYSWLVDDDDDGDGIATYFVVISNLIDFERTFEREKFNQFLKACVDEINKLKNAAASEVIRISRSTLLVSRACLVCIPLQI
jgi:hypothetical protein